MNAIANRAPATEIATTADRLTGLAIGLAEAATSPNTLRAYESGARDFSRFCAELDAGSLPATPQTVALYVAHLVEAGRSMSTIHQRLAAIRFAHRRAGLDTPTTHVAVEAVTAGARRTLGTAGKPKRALLVASLRRIVRTLDRDTHQGRRDAALMLLGFAGAFRRSELVALDVADLDFSDGGCVVTVRRSKTDQGGEGRKVSVPFGRGATCPVRALRAWLDSAEIGEGPVFRSMRKGDRVLEARLSAKGAARIVKACAELVGLDSADFAGHSLRRGLVTSAVRAGKSDAEIMSTTGHKSRAMVDRYREDAGRFDDSASAGLL